MKNTRKIKITIYIILLSIPLIFANIIVRPIYFWVSKNVQNISANKENLEKHVEFFTTLEKQRSYINLEELNQAADYIYNDFKSYWCDEVKYQPYQVSGEKYKNVICTYKWKSDEKIIIWAHYDVCAEDDFSFFQWADDNASWVAWVLELARLVWQNKTNLKNSIEFVAYTLEEPPFFDSENMWSFVHAKSLKNNWEKVEYMIALEMIGCFSEKQDYPIMFLKRLYPSKGDFIALVWKLSDSKVKEIKKAMQENSSIDTRSLSAPSFVLWIDFSDHRNYWIQGYRAYMVTDTSFYRNKNYHTKFDTIDTLDFDKMNEVVKWVYGAIFGE